MRKISEPVIYEIEYTADELEKFSESVRNFKKKQEIFIGFPNSLYY